VSKPIAFLVTKNKNKVEEANGVLSAYGLFLEQANIEKLEIQSEDLKAIAWTAALYAYRTLKAPVVVDDSGLFIEALGGFPGPYSSYVYRKLGVHGILRLMEGVDDRRACFRTVLAVIIPPLDALFEGRVCGQITYEPRGDKGFGFDPIFVPGGRNKTFAEMSLEEKNSVSHRSQALRLFAEWYVGLRARDNFKGTVDSDIGEGGR